MNFITQNGQKEVIINAASFKDASNLRKAVMKSIIESDFAKNLDKNALETLNLTSILDVGLKLIFNADTSENFEKAIFECLKVCLYENKKITLQLFDDITEAREDYYEIVSKCCEENLRPFFKSLVTEFQARLKLLGQNQLLK
jgi:hypothetical protein|nr:MAG TPA: tail assembly chaperone protein [Caudoviricetes sp.]